MLHKVISKLISSTAVYNFEVIIYCNCRIKGKCFCKQVDTLVKTFLLVGISRLKSFLQVSTSRYGILQISSILVLLNCNLVC